MTVKNENSFAVLSTIDQGLHTAVDPLELLEEADVAVAAAVSTAESLAETIKELGIGRNELEKQLEFATVALTGCRSLWDLELAKVAGRSQKKTFMRAKIRSIL
jgi:hypothetical protein